MTPSTALITRDYNGLTFTFRPDGYFNMTKAAAHFGKKLSHFWDSPTTTEYVVALTELPGFRAVNTSEATMGRNGGTWAHPKLAVFFARWLDVRFAVWCDAMVEDILKGNAEVVITKPEESAVRRSRRTTPRPSAPSLTASSEHAPGVCGAH